MPMQVKDVMGHFAIAVVADASFADIITTIERFKVGAIAVVDADRRVMGIVSEDDLLLKETDVVRRGVSFLEGSRRRREHRKAAGTTAVQIMTAPAVTVTPGTPVRDAARLMHQNQIKQLPVIDSLTGRIVGTVHQRDLLRVFRRQQAEIRAEVDGLIRERAGLAPESLSIRVEDGVVTIKGGAERRSQVVELADAICRVEGVVTAEIDMTFARDDTVQSAGVPPLL
jgi:CBS domain-containing protein